MRAMILAAGRGERLRPLTDTVPKPLVAAGGRALVEHTIDALACAGVTGIVINVSWLADVLIDALGDGRRFGVPIRYTREEPGALETAGGIANALPLLGPGPFIVVNGDIYCDIDYTTVARPGNNDLATLVLVPNPAHHPAGDFSLHGDRVGPPGNQTLTYAGIGIYRAALFDAVGPGRAPLGPLLHRAAAAARLRGTRFDGTWSDAGTPERLAALRDTIGP